MFNTGWTTLAGHDGWFSGPYKLGSYDLTSQIITLVANDKWWGDKPKLDRVIFRVVPDEAVPAAYVNNEIDSFDIGINADALARAQAVTTGDIRKAAGPNWRHITLNQDAGLLTDKTIRQAVLMSLDRSAIASSDLAGLNYDAQILNNHVFLNNQAQYKDLAKETGLGFDKEKAKQMLDTAGWTVGSDGFRAKGGKTLEITFTTITGRQGLRERGPGVPVAAEGRGDQGHDHPHRVEGLRHDAVAAHVPGDRVHVGGHAVPLPRR